MLERSLGDERKAKRPKLEAGSSKSDDPNKPGLMTLSDDVLLHVLSFLEAPDLLNLTECSARLANICCDKTLWERVELRRHHLTLYKLKKFVRFLQSNTKFIATKGPNWTKRVSGPSFSRSLLRGIVKNAPNLTTMIIERHVIDCSKVVLEDFPSTLESLTLQSCKMLNLPSDKSYFYRIEKTLPKLKVLDLADNDWFVPHSLLALSKSVSLERLVLKGCDISDSLPYASLAANFGFNSLRVLDLRHTFVTDVEITCFNRSTTLRELYLSGPEEEGLGPMTAGAVTDFGIITFGQAPRGAMRRNDLNLGEGVIVIEVGAYPRPVCRLEVLVLRNFMGITDLTLNHVALSMKDLKFLDVSGTACTPEGVEDFRKNRPEVSLVT